MAQGLTRFLIAALGGIILSGCVSPTHSTGSYYLGATLLDAPVNPHLSWESIEPADRPAEVPTLLMKVDERVADSGSSNQDATERLKLEKERSDALYEFFEQEWSRQTQAPPDLPNFPMLYEGRYYNVFFYAMSAG